MIKLLYIFNGFGASEMVLADSNRAGMPGNGHTRFLYSAESVFSFENEVFKEAIKYRMGNRNEITFKYRGTSLEDFLNMNSLLYISFFVGREIWRLGRYSKPYVVIKSLDEYYSSLHKHECMMNASTVI